MKMEKVGPKEPTSFGSEVPPGILGGEMYLTIDSFLKSNFPKSRFSGAELYAAFSKYQQEKEVPNPMSLDTFRETLKALCDVQILAHEGGDDYHVKESA